MAKNRLKLDFSLDFIDERKEFVNSYIEQEQFKTCPLTEDELETIANYILWGKDKDGKNAVQKRELEIDTKYSTWKRTKEVESLEELMESSTFDENILQKIGTFTPTKKKRETFDRAKALAEAPKEILEDYNNLFKQIDETDLIINYYEIIHGKRTKEPREQLLEKFTEQEKEDCYNRAAKMNQRNYLKMRHYLVELRASQFTLRDSYKFQIQRESRSHIKYEAPPGIFGEDITVFPLGIFDNSVLANNIFITESQIPIRKYTEAQLKEISDFYWEQQKKERKGTFFDFCDLEHVYQLILNYIEFKDELDEENLNDSMKDLLRTLEFYISCAQLDDMHREILEMKINKVKNEEIAKYINKKYQKSYTVNYISTIFRQKIIKEINAAAEFHKEVIENLYFPENFRTCTRCGEYLLKSPYNFVRKSRATDGFTGRCKRCDRLVREERKIIKEAKK